MQNKAKIVAISGICGGVSVVCLLLLGLPIARYALLVLAVVASMAVAIPTMASGKPIFSVIVYLVSGVVGTIFGIANIVYVAPVVAFFMPMALVKVWAETPKISAKINQQTIDDPFGNGDDKQVVAVEIQTKPRMSKALKWILYYVLLQVGIGLTLLATYIFAQSTFTLIVEHKLFVALLIVCQALPFAYNFLLGGAFAMVAKILQRHIKQD